MVMLIYIVNPVINRGMPPREIKQADIIQVPTTYQRGSWNLGDMLSLDSIGNLFKAYNDAERRIAAKVAVKRAPSKRKTA